MQRSKTFQITSNEPAQSILGLVAETAQRHELVLDISEPATFTAPFCGDEYFIQEIRLLPQSGTRKGADFDICLSEIESIVRQELSDGYIEIQ